MIKTTPFEMVFIIRDIMSKHLTLEDRIVIETQLSVGTALAEIAKILCKARSTIGREVGKHRQEQDTGAFERAKNKCVRRRDCSLRGAVCG